MQPEKNTRTPLFGRKKRHIKTKKIQTLERLDKLAWLCPLLVFVWTFHDHLSSLTEMFDEGLVTGIFNLLITIVFMGAFYLPLMMMWRAISRTLKKNAIAQSTFPVLEDFDYFRDELTGISPATISMCVDFEIERDKDLTAQLLRFTLQGLIETDGSQITVRVAQNPPGLPESDCFLLNALRKGKLSNRDANDWASLAYKEVINGPYLTPKEPKKRKARDAAGCLGCLPFFLLFSVMEPLLSSAPIIAIENMSPDLTDTEILAAFASDPQLILGAAIITFLALALFCTMALPIAIVLKTLAGTSLKKKTFYKRTEAGDVLTEEIYGLKNFLHDFSDLESAQKETLVLWDDFLVYAVVLEENESIVSEITAMRNLNIITPEYTE